MHSIQTRMNRHCSILGILILVLAGSCVSQQPNTSESDLPSSHKERKALAVEHIAALKQGTLIVRLPSKSKTIDVFRTAGKDDKADKIEAEVFAENQAMVQAFHDEFNFCKFVFISVDETSIVTKNTDTAVYLNEELQIDPSIRVLEGPIFFAQYGNVKQVSWSDDRNPSAGLDYIEGSSLDARFYLSDSELQQLHDPLPFHRAWPIRIKDYPKMVRKFNQGLVQFYEENH